jgi:dTMP kinase
MLMLAARAQHVTERIRPALESGRDVVVDRYSGSTLAYQGYGRGLPLAAVKEACDLATSDLWPDLSVLLDIPVNLGAARRAGAGGAPDRIESERQEFHERVTDGFRRLAADDPEHWVVIDGMGAPDEVAALVRHAVDSMLGQRAVS